MPYIAYIVSMVRLPNTDIIIEQRYYLAEGGYQQSPDNAKKYSNKKDIPLDVFIIETK